MERFDRVLQTVERRLDVGEPERSRILLEMARDLEDLYAAYRERGLSPERAARRSESMLGASPEAVDRLGEVHAPPLARLVSRLAAGDGHRVERALLTLLTLGAVGGALYALVASGGAHEASPFVWPLLGLLGVTVGVSGARVLERFMRAEVPARGRRGRPAALLGLAALSATVGAIGAVLEVHAAAAAAARAGDASLDLVLPYLGRAADLVTLALGLSLAGLLSWFHLHRRAVRIERLRSEALSAIGLHTEPEDA